MYVYSLHIQVVFIHIFQLRGEGGRGEGGALDLCMCYTLLLLGAVLGVVKGSVGDMPPQPQTSTLLQNP